MPDNYGNDLEREQRIQLTKDEQKQIVKAAIQEWLDAQFSKFGRYSLAALLSAAMGALFYLWLSAHGFKGM